MKNLRHYDPLEMPFPTVSFYAKSEFFRFWPKTMDYSQGFWPELRSFFVVLLLVTRRCYEAEICVILLPLRCAFAWFLSKSNFLVSGRKHQAHIHVIKFMTTLPLQFYSK